MTSLINPGDAPSAAAKVIQRGSQRLAALVEGGYHQASEWILCRITVRADGRLACQREVRKVLAGRKSVSFHMKAFSGVGVMTKSC
jgi:hypothetical protein